MCHSSDYCYHTSCVSVYDVDQEVLEVDGPIQTPVTFTWTYKHHVWLCFQFAEFDFLLGGQDAYAFVSMGDPEVDEAELLQSVTFTIYDEGDASISPTTTS